MTTVSSQAALSDASPSLLAGYATDIEVSVETGKSIRTLRDWRQKRTGPPFVILGNRPLYPRDGFRAWLKAIEQAPKLRRGRAA